ncbi:hypothetical protein C8J57DRAFT_1465383 [Mycena rebaudengoi]|nr:hypothetical protein C8J57DRAFT_1465383 [Mycena rebaudengoi]
MHMDSRPLSSGTSGSRGARNKELRVRQKEEAKKEEEREKRAPTPDSKNARGRSATRDGRDAQPVACAGREGAGEVEAAYVSPMGGRSDSDTPWWLRKIGSRVRRSRGDGDVSSLLSRLQRTRDDVPCVAALPRWWCPRDGAVEVGVVVEDVLVARDAGVTAANGRWEEAKLMDGGEEVGKMGAHTRRESGNEEYAEGGRTGREGKDDVGKGEGRSSNAAQAAFDADEEGGGERREGVDVCIHGERRGSAAGRVARGGKPGADDACDEVGGGVGREERREKGKGRQWMEGKGAGRDEMTRVAKLKPTRRVECERAAEGMVRDEGKARQDKGGGEEDGRGRDAETTERGQRKGEQYAVEGKGEGTKDRRREEEWMGEERSSNGGPEGRKECVEVGAGFSCGEKEGAGGGMKETQMADVIQPVERKRRGQQCFSRVFDALRQRVDELHDVHAVEGARRGEELVLGRREDARALSAPPVAGGSRWRQSRISANADAGTIPFARS